MARSHEADMREPWWITHAADVFRWPPKPRRGLVGAGRSGLVFAW